MILISCFVGIHTLRVIIVTSHERQDVANHWQIDCFFFQMSVQATKKTPTIWINDLLLDNSPMPSRFLSQRANKAKKFQYSD